MSTDFNEKQIRILQVAEQLFAEKGFDGTSIRDIAREAKINIAMVSYYFGSKERMLEALILSRTADLKIQLENLSREAIPPMEKLDKLIDLYIARMQKYRCIYQIVHFELSNKKREINIKSFTEVKRRNLDFLREIIEEGQQAGVFHKQVNIYLIPPTILGTYFHFQMNHPLYEDLLGLDTDEAFDGYIQTQVAAHIKQTIKAILTHEP